MRLSSRSHITWVFLIPILFTGISCSTTKEIVEEPVIINPKPDWVMNRPMSGSNYIGIGVSSKMSEPVDYAQVAKKSALNDLASEIKVNVQGETFLNTLEVNQMFREEFLSNITTTTSEELEGYDLAGTWEDESAYWVYYRLSKAKHAQIKKEKKDRALASSADYFVKGKDAQMQGNIGTSLDLHFRALLELKDYWHESNEYLLNGEQVLLDNEIYSSMLSLANGIRIEPEMSSIVLSNENNFQEEIGVLVHFNGNPLRDIRLQYSYDKGQYARPKTILTNEMGTGSVRVYDVNIDNKSNVLFLTVDLDEMISEEYDSKLTGALVKKLKTGSKEVPITVNFPKCYIEFSETNFGKPLGNAPLSSAIRKELTQKGFNFTGDKMSSDYVIQIESNTVKGGTSNGFHVAYLQMNMDVINSLSGEVVYHETITKLKGLHLDFNSAGLEAYKNGSKRIESEIAKNLLNSLL